MATIAPTVTQPNADSVRITWVDVTENDTCGVYEGLSEYADRSVQVSGTFSGMSVDIQGSDEYDGREYPSGEFNTLNDTFGNPLTFSAAGGPTQINEYCHAIKPSRSGGSGSSVRITINARRHKG